MFDSIAIVGATGAVGQLIRNMLEEREFPHEKITFLASARSAGSTIEFGGKQHTVKELTPEAFEGIDLAIGSTPDPIAKDFVPWAVERGCVVVDESGYWRMDPKVPLVIPEVNPEAVENHQGIIASPNCSTTQMVVALKPLHDAGRVRRVIVSTYQATSGAGVGGQRDLINGSKAALENKQHKYETFAHAIAFNLIPQIGSHKQAGYTSEEMKMVYETHKILGDDTIRVCPTCVRVPVSNCHSESILVETEQKITRRRSSRPVFHRSRASRSSTTCRTASTRSRAIATATMPCSSAASAKTSRATTASRSGASATTSAKAPQRTPCKSPNC